MVAWVDTVSYEEADGRLKETYDTASVQDRQGPQSLQSA